MEVVLQLGVFVQELKFEQSLRTQELKPLCQRLLIIVRLQELMHLGAVVLSSGSDEPEQELLLGRVNRLWNLNHQHPVVFLLTL